MLPLALTFTGDVDPTALATFIHAVGHDYPGVRWKLNSPFPIEWTLG